MHRLFQFATLLLPLALGTAGAAAQETGGNAPPRVPSAGRSPATPPPHFQGQRQAPERWRRDAAVPSPSPSRWERVQPPASQDSRMSDAVRRVQRSTQGQILGAERVSFDGRDITRVKYMDDSGRVRYMDDPGAAERRAPRRADNGQP